MGRHVGRRLAKTAATTAVAAAAVAALTASQAPGVTDMGGGETATSQPSPDGTGGGGDSTATGGSPYYTDLPPLNTPTPSPSTSTGSGSPVGTGEAEAGIPATVLDAYKKAEAALRESKPGCNLPWQLLAAIGKVESGQARGGNVAADGTTISPILGPVLNGNGFANISDTDNGVYDGDSTHDRAIGPMQFIPSTWEPWGQDANGDGKRDPNNIYDAALAAGHYLCAGDRDLSVRKHLKAAILSYNHSTEYLNLVLTWLEYYRKGTHEVPDGTGVLPKTPEPTGGSGSGSGSGSRSGSGSGSGDRSQPPATPAPPSGRPDVPAKPSPPGSPAKPSPPGDSEPPATPAPPPTSTDTVDHVEDAGTGKLTAMAGDTFAEKITVRPETKAGKAVAKVRIRFVITGDTDTVFAGGEKVATVVTGSAGTATAPVLVAGEKTGDLRVTASVVGRTVAGVNYTATVTPRAADALARTGDTALTCTPGGEFADAVEVKATYRGAVADGVAATATLIKAADDATENDKGPYFKDADGKTVRTLTGLKTDANGVLKLPKLYADDTTGTFLLRVTTTGGATLTVELKVAAADTASPSEPASPSASATS